MSINSNVKMLFKQLVNRYFYLFTKTFSSLSNNENLLKQFQTMDQKNTKCFLCHLQLIYDEICYFKKIYLQTSHTYDCFVRVSQLTTALILYSFKFVSSFLCFYCFTGFYLAGRIFDACSGILNQLWQNIKSQRNI